MLRNVLSTMNCETQRRIFIFTSLYIEEYLKRAIGIMQNASITNLQQVAMGLAEVLKMFQELLDGSDGRKLSVSEALVTHTPNCYSLLDTLKKDISPGTGRRHGRNFTFSL